MAENAEQAEKALAEMNLARCQLKLVDRSTTLPEGDDPWQGDKLDRAGLAEGLADMLSGQQGPLTVALDGTWGSGKTYFLTRFREIYRQRNGISVYFNAWRDDFLDDPLLSLLGQLTSELGTNPNDHILGSVAQAALPVLTKAGLAMCKSFLRHKLGVDLSEISVDDLATRGEKLLEQFGEMTASRDELCNALSKLGHKVREETGKPLLVIVDELDRCRPTYAVEMLERIKHLFSLENIVFLLGIDQAELEKSIAAVYGDIDAQRYLYRFVNMEFPLPAVSLHKFVWGQLDDTHLGQLFHGNPIHSDRITKWTSIFTAIADAQRMPLRDVEHALRKFALVLVARHGLLSGEGALLAAYAVALKMSRNRNLYRRFLRGECKPKEIVDSLFLHLDGNGFLEMGRQNPITNLYRTYYTLANDNEFRNQYDTLCDVLAIPGDDPLDGTLLPNLALQCSAEDLRGYFVQAGRGTIDSINTWQNKLAEIDEAMSNAVELP